MGLRLVLLRLRFVGLLLTVLVVLTGERVCVCMCRCVHGFKVIRGSTERVCSDRLQWFKKSFALNRGPKH